MNHKSQKGAAEVWTVFCIVAAVIVLCLAAYGLVHLVSGSSGTNGRGGTSNADAIALDSFLTTGSYVQAATTLQAGTQLLLGGSSSGSYTAQSTSVKSEQLGSGACTTGATSTALILTNPYAATSTYTINSFTVSGTQPTTTSYIIGTTTATQGLTSTTVSPIGGSFQMGSSTPGYLTPGVTGNTPTPVTIPGQRTFLVGPTQSVAVYATSSVSGVGSTSYNPALNGCVLKGTWTN